jgi:hypothetical protein
MVGRLPPREPRGRTETLTQELGLDEERSFRVAYERLPATELSGTRHGRPVALRIGIVSSIRGKGMTEVQVDVPVAPFRIRAESGRLVVEPGAAPEVEEALGELAPATKVWCDVVVEGDRTGSAPGGLAPVGLRVRLLAR